MPKKDPKVEARKKKALAAAKAILGDVKKTKKLTAEVEKEVEQLEKDAKKKG